MATRDQVIEAAKSAPQLLQLAKEHDPKLYAVLTGPSAWSVWASPVAGVITGIAARYGLDWDKDTCMAIAGVVIFVGTAIFHRFAPGLGANGPPPSVVLLITAGLGGWLGCAPAVGGPSAETVATRYEQASLAIATYGMTPRADPRQLALAQACDDVAWEQTGPVLAALKAGHSPSAGAVALASDAVDALQRCLRSLQVAAP